MKESFTYLLATAALIIISAAAMAQGGSSPFVGSTHEYKVTPGANGNIYTWTISGGTGSSGYTINSAVSGTTGTGEITLSVTWNTASATDYTISFTETTTESCSTVKDIDVTVSTNNFDVNIGSLTDACNNNSGSVSPADSATSIITIPFDMETGTTWGPNWEVAFNLAVTSSNARILSVALASGASGTLNDLSGGNYSITGITGSAVDGTGTTSIEVEVKGYSFTDVTVNAEITSARELLYNTPAASTGSWSPVTNTIYKIPDTSDITTD